MLDCMVRDWEAKMKLNYKMRIQRMRSLPLANGENLKWQVFDKKRGTENTRP